MALGLAWAPTSSESLSEKRLPPGTSALRHPHHNAETVTYVREGSLPIHQDALMYSALLNAGQHVSHEISQGRSVWLHLVQGEATFANVWQEEGARFVSVGLAEAFWASGRTTITW